MYREMEKRIRQGLEDCLAGVEERPSLEGRVLERIQGQRHAPVKLSVAMVMALVLVLATVAAVAAGVIAGWFRVEQQQVGAMRSCVSDGDTLYLLTSGGLHTWQPEQTEPVVNLSAQQLCEAGLSPEGRLCLRSEELILLHPETRSLWQIEGQKLQLLADYRGTILDCDSLWIENVVYAGKMLIIRAVPQEATEDDALLFRWHLSTGNVEQLPLSGVLELCACDETHVLAIRRDLSVGKEALIRMDAATGDIVETLYTAPIQEMEGIMVHPKTRQIIAFVAGAPSLWNGSGWTPMQGFALSVHANDYAIVGDRLAAISHNDLQVISLVPESSLTTLRIRGSMPMNNEDEAFQQQLPGVAVQREKTPSLTAAEIRQAIAGGDTTDLFHVSLNWDMVTLFRDGTLAALPSSQVLEEDAQAMLSAFREGLGVDGKRYAVPSSLSVMVWESGETVPATFTELLEAQAGSGLFCIASQWADSGWTKTEYADYLLTAHILANGTENLNFHEPAFREALQALREAQFPGEAQTGEWVVTTNITVDLHGRQLSPVQAGEDRLYSQSETRQAASVLWQLPSRVAAEVPPTVPARMTVYVLNPNAANPELALRFLEYVAAHRRPDQDALLKPLSATPVLQHEVELQIRRIIEEQHAFDEKSGLEPDEDALQRRIDAILAAPDSWAVDENRLQIYREEIAPYATLQLHPLLTRQAKEAGGLYQQMLEAVLAYADGDTTLEECLKKLDELSQQQ